MAMVALKYAGSHEAEAVEVDLKEVIVVGREVQAMRLELQQLVVGHVVQAVEVELEEVVVVGQEVQQV